VLNRRREAQQAHNLGYPGPSDSLSSSDGGLADDLPRLELGPPVHGLAEQLNDPGRPGISGVLGLAAGRRDGINDPLSDHSALHGSHVAVLERPLGPQGDFDCLVTVDRRVSVRYGLLAINADVHNPEPDLGFHAPYSAVSSPTYPGTHVDLYLAAASSGTVRVLDLRGRLVAELHRGLLQAGHNVFVWNGVDSGGMPVASGVYSVLVETPDQRHVKKVLLVK